MSSAATALAVLETLASRQPAGVSELARRLDISKPAAQRALQVLADTGWIRRSHQQPGRWVLSAKVLEVAGHMGEEMGLRELARPLMQELVDASTEAAHLSVLDGTDIVMIDQVESTQLMRIHWPLGSRSPAYAAASGKALLSALPGAALPGHLPDELCAITSQTITDVGGLTEELATIRGRGWSTQRGELRDDIASIAAPILTGPGHPVAAMSLFMPVHRFPDDCQPLGRLVQDACAKLGASLALRR